MSPETETRVRVEFRECCPQRHDFTPMPKADAWIPTVQDQIVEGRKYYIAGAVRWPEKGSGIESAKNYPPHQHRTPYATVTLPIEFYCGSGQEVLEAANELCALLNKYAPNLKT